MAEHHPACDANSGGSCNCMHPKVVVTRSATGDTVSFADYLALESKLKAADEAWHEQEDELQALRGKLNHASALTVELQTEVRALQGKLDTIRGDRDLGIKRLGELQSRLDVVSKEVEGMEALLEKEHNDLLAWKHRATSAEYKLDSALAVLRRISEYTEGAASGVGYQCKEWADAFLGGAVEKSRAVSMKAGREPDPPKGCTVADPQAYSDDKSRQPSPFVVERQPPNVCSRCKIHPRTSPLLCDHCIEELGHA